MIGRRSSPTMQRANHEARPPQLRSAGRLPLPGSGDRGLGLKPGWPSVRSLFMSSYLEEHAMDPLADLVGFCREQKPRLVGTLTLYCGDPDVAEELAQETLSRVCLHWRRVARMPVPSAWSYRVAINLANSYFRRRAAERRAHDRFGSGVSHFHHDPDTASAIDIRNAVAGLPRRQRAAVILRFYSDFSVAEVASLMECPEGTVKTLTRRAVASLRRQILAEEASDVP
jgi:RNA polymerase sigma factor (sigma-70 family)